MAQLVKFSPQKHEDLSYDPPAPTLAVLLLERRESQEFTAQISSSHGEFP